LFVSLYISFAERVLSLIPKNIKIGEPSNNGWYSSYVFSGLPKYQYEDEDVQAYGRDYIKALDTYSFGAGKISFKQFQKDFLPHITLLTSSLYIFAGIYKLIFVIL
jgi:hypothetical protein